ncbi:MAG: SDR family oxidoreductase [Streptosporangiaceae bacterium]
MASPARCLVTGASGYIGGRLVPELLAAGYSVRCMARDPGKLSDRPWSAQVEITAADALDRSGVRRALDGIEVAYYLIHSLGTGSSFEQRDRDSARIFAGAARDAGVRRIVYLGGIISGQHGELSPHLRSRGEVGQILLDSGVPTAALQAAVIIGSGSASFEMLRYLTERLPAMVTPMWVDTRIQPIAVRDVLRYLVGAAALPAEVSRRFDLGGPDILSYAQMMKRYAAVAGLPPRVLIRVPVLTPRLSSHWVGLVTPVPSGLAKPLVESLRNEVVASEHDIAAYIPDPPGGLLPLDQAITLALRHTREGNVSTSWTSAATPGAPSDPLPSDPSWAGGSLYVDERSSVVHASPAALWQVIEGIGGTSGWYSMRAAWAARGMLDRMAGGVGLRRGRRDPRHLRVGDALDFWRVETITPGSLLRLRAEMKLPGLAWLELSVGQDGDGQTTYRQRAIFQPRGLAGHAYWRSIAPFHGIVFGGMLRNVTAAAERAGQAWPTALSGAG